MSKTISAPNSSVLFRRAAGFIPTGVAVISGDSVSMTVSSLCCISWDPALVSLSLQRSSRTAAILIPAGRFHVRLLREGEEELTKNGCPSSNIRGLLEFECEIRDVYDAGDHNLVVAEVQKVQLSEGFPLVYWRRGLHCFRPKYDFLASHAALDAFLTAWEHGSLPANRWNHAAHVAVGATYAVRHGDTALERIRCGIVRYNEAVGTANTDHSGYHETLTRLWAGIVRTLVRGMTDPWQAACYAVEEVGEERDLHCLYYSFDVARDPVARRTWIEPDLSGPYPLA